MPNRGRGGGSAPKPRKQAASQPRGRVSKSVPVAGSTSNRPRPVQTVTTAAGCVVTNCETIAKLTGAGGFKSVAMLLMPGAREFVWLSAAAGVYSKYRWRKLRLYYTPLCSTSSSGEVAMGLSYDPSIERLPSTMEDALQSYMAVSGAPWANANTPDLSDLSRPIPAGAMAIDLDCKRLSSQWYQYITTAQLASVIQSRTQYVPAEVELSTDLPQGVVGGRIWASYQVELIEPVSYIRNTQAP